MKKFEVNIDKGPVKMVNDLLNAGEIFKIPSKKNYPESDSNEDHGQNWQINKLDEMPIPPWFNNEK